MFLSEHEINITLAFSGINSKTFIYYELYTPVLLKFLGQ